MIFAKDCLSNYATFKKPCIVDLEDIRSILAYGKGTYHVTAELDGCVQSISLRNVLYLPELDKNLLSVRAMANLGANVMFEDGMCRITRNCKLLAVGELRGKLYVLKIIQNERLNIAREESSLVEGMDGISKEK